MDYNNFEKKIVKILFIFIIHLKLLFCEIKDYYSSDVLENDTNYLVDIKDYHNLSIIISTSKRIYTGIPPNLRSTLNANIYNCSSAVTYNENYILISCLKDSLLSKVDIKTGFSSSLLKYSDLSLSVSAPSSICSISLYENTIFIFVNQLKEDNYTQNIGVKLNLINDDNNGPILDNSTEIKYYYNNSNINQNIDSMRQISCEVLTFENNENYRLVCAKEMLLKKKYIIYFSIINNDFNALESPIISSKTFDHVSGVQLFKINKYNVRCLMRKGILNINLTYINNYFSILISENQFSTIYYETTANLYGCSNDYIFSAKYGKERNNKRYYYYAINKIGSYDYFKFFDYNVTNIIKIIGYYNENNDYIIFISQYLDNIKYFTLKGISNFFNIKSNTKIFKINSNTETQYNISNIIESSQYFAPLSIEHSTQYVYNSSPLINYYEYGNYTFPIDNNNQLYINKSDNTWINYTFGFIEEVEKKFLAIFYLPNATVIIQTCELQCINCPEDYNKCGLCRISNYSILNGAENDNNCYPINQLFEGYIYNSTTNYFEKCYHSCKFCSLMGSESSSSKHNCKVCSDGYYPSYNHLGNCYKINNNELNSTKYIKQITDENFTSINSCPEINKNLKIYSTGECIEICPNTTPYYSYNYTYIDFSEYIGKEIPIQQYILNSLLPPKYLISDFCFEVDLLSGNTNESIHICRNSWHRDIKNYIIKCYDINYCYIDDYKYYLDDSKECSPNECPFGYYQFNFQCYKNNCPNNTIPESTNSYKCESIFNYCYINEKFQTYCNDLKNNEYIYRYNNTKQYLKNCNESLTYTIEGKKTYLYNETCYIDCPKYITYSDEDNRKCICKYYTYYYDDNNYICYGEKEICNDKIPVIDLKICLNTINDCINKEYKVFNNKCYSIGCPNLTKKNSDEHTCICQYTYYNESNLLNCFEQSESCENKGYLYTNPDTLECFNSLEDCFNKNNIFYFNMYCYKDQCPSNTIPLSSINNEKIKNILISIFSIGDNVKDNMCVCNITNSYWIARISNGKYLLECTERCGNGYETDEIIHRCFEKCNPSKHYIFNDICYIEGCPDGTMLNPEIPDSRICICKESSYKENNMTICCEESKGNCPPNIIYPKEYYDDPENCLAIYNNKCYLSCPEGTKLDENDKNSLICICQYLNYIIQLSNYEMCLYESDLCPNNLPYEIISSRQCVELCSVNQLLNNTCRINNIAGNLNDITKNIKNLINEYNNINEKTDDNIILIGNNIIYEIVTSKNHIYNNITSYINFGECETRLKSLYNLDYLLIFKYDIKVNGTNPTIVQYEIYNPYNKSKLDLSICEDTKIDIYIPVSLSDEYNDLYLNMLDSGYDILDENDKFYNDICTTYTNENSTDMTLSDRRKVYYDENNIFCEENCEYANYNITTQVVKCECPIKTQENEIIKFDKNDLGSYFNIKTYTNFEIIRCYKLIFSKEGQTKNYGSYILLVIILLFIILLTKYYYTHNKALLEIIVKAFQITEKRSFPPKKKNKIKIIKKIYRKRYSSLKNNIVIKNIIEGNSNSTRLSKLVSPKSSIYFEKSIKENNKLNIKDDIDEKQKNENIKINPIITIDKVEENYLEIELNSMEYEKALIIDKRKFIQYYFSLLQKGHILFLTFFDNKDYNIIYIKYILFLFISSLYLVVNALFFTDETMHKIYEDNGIYKFVSKLPQIVYSSIISIIINILIKLLALSERDILKIRKIRDRDEYDKESKKVIKYLKFKFNIFIIINIIILIFFWYYISAFCSVYSNTQTILLKDTFISFVFSLLYPFLIYLLPSCLRFIALKNENKNEECLYIISTYIAKI